MTLTTHAAIGAALGSTIGDPALGFLLGLTSHLLVDMIPHGDNNLNDGYRKSNKKKAGVAYVTIDAILAILFLMSVISGRPDDISNFAFSAAVTGSVLPDLLVGFKEIFPRNPLLKKIYKIHFFFHDFFSRNYGDTKRSYALFIVVLVKFFIP